MPNGEVHTIDEWPSTSTSVAGDGGDTRLLDVYQERLAENPSNALIKVLWMESSADELSATDKEKVRRVRRSIEPLDVNGRSLYLCSCDCDPYRRILK